MASFPTLDSSAIIQRSNELKYCWAVIRNSKHTTYPKVESWTSRWIKWVRLARSAHALLTEVQMSRMPFVNYSQELDPIHNLIRQVVEVRYWNPRRRPRSMRYHITHCRSRSKHLSELAGNRRTPSPSSNLAKSKRVLSIIETVLQRGA